MQRTVEPSGNFAFIDTIRGAAALLVFYFHLHTLVFYHLPEQAISHRSLTYYFVLGYFDLGKFAVGCFFVVSGFLIPATLASPDSNLRKFSIHRAFRLYPAYWFSLLAALVCMNWLAGWKFDLRTFLVNLTMFQKFFGVTDVIGAYWTLQIELIFYILCGVLFAVGRLQKRAEIIACTLAAAMLCALARHYTHRELPVALFLALAMMFFGDSLRAFDQGRVAARQINITFVCIAAALIPIFMAGYNVEGARYIVTYWAAMTVFCLAYRFRRIFSEARWIRRGSIALADCSYSIYLLHAPIGLILGIYLQAIYHNRLLTAIAAFSSTLLVSACVYHGIEKPMIRLGKSLGRDRTVH